MGTDVIGNDSGGGRASAGRRGEDRDRGCPGDRDVAGGIVACNCVPPMHVVWRTAPFQRTCDPLMKLLPLTVNVNPAPPAPAALAGTRLTASATGLGGAAGPILTTNESTAPADDVKSPPAAGKSVALVVPTTTASPSGASATPRPRSRPCPPTQVAPSRTPGGAQTYVERVGIEGRRRVDAAWCGAAHAESDDGQVQSPTPAPTSSRHRGSCRRLHSSTPRTPRAHCLAETRWR